MRSDRGEPRPPSLQLEGERFQAPLKWFQGRPRRGLSAAAAAEWLVASSSRSQPRWLHSDEVFDFIQGLCPTRLGIWLDLTVESIH